MLSLPDRHRSNFESPRPCTTTRSARTIAPRRPTGMQGGPSGKCRATAFGWELETLFLPALIPCQPGTRTMNYIHGPDILEVTTHPAAPVTSSAPHSPHPGPGQQPRPSQLSGPAARPVRTLACTLARTLARTSARAQLSPRDVCSPHSIARFSFSSKCPGHEQDPRVRHARRKHHASTPCTPQTTRLATLTADRAPAEGSTQLVMGGLLVVGVRPGGISSIRRDPRRRPPSANCEATSRGAQSRLPVRLTHGCEEARAESRSPSCDLTL